MTPASPILVLDISSAINSSCSFKITQIVLTKLSVAKVFRKLIPVNATDISLEQDAECRTGRFTCFSLMRDGKPRDMANLSLDLPYALSVTAPTSPCPMHCCPTDQRSKVGDGCPQRP